MAGVRLTGLFKMFGATAAVDGVDLDITDGEFMVLLGPSGCGKSTLLRMIAGLEEPTSGRIALGNKDITDTAPRDRNVAMVFQNYALYPHLTVAGNIGFPLRARRLPRANIRDKVDLAARTVGLSELVGRRPAELSGGQRQRVALARAIVREPGVFLMDEPLSNLDAALRSSTRTDLIELHRRIGTTFVYVTHDQVEAMTMATRITLLNNGRIEQVGSPSELYDVPDTVFVAKFLGSPPMNLLDAQVVSESGHTEVVTESFRLPLEVTSESTSYRVPVTVGIRPERIRLQGNQPSARGFVVAVENLGADEIIHVRLGDTTQLGDTAQLGGDTIKVRAARPSSVHVGETAELFVDSSDLHFFDPSSGTRMRWVDSTSPQTAAA